MKEKKELNLFVASHCPPQKHRVSPSTTDIMYTYAERGLSDFA